jgi:AraC-like DNA-binding protein/TolB-like protein
MNHTDHKDLQFIKRLTDLIEANLHNDQFGVNELARELNMSRSTLHRKVKESTSLSISRFICQLRLKKAFKILLETSLSVSETAFECGFNSVTYFIKCFHEYYGYPPGNARDIHTEEPPGANTGTKRTGRWKEWLKPVAGIFIFAVIIFVIAESAYFGSSVSGKEVKSKSIAILPLKFEGSDSMRLLAAGLTEAILNNLMEIGNLNVRPKTSVEQYRESLKPLKVIARELNVDYVIEMSGYQKDNTIHFQANMADAVSDAYLWRKSYPAYVNEETFLGLQNRISADILQKTKTQLSPQEKKKLEKPMTDNPAALNLYLQGLSHLNVSDRVRSANRWNEVVEESFKAKNNLRKAIELDSGFVEAYGILAHIYISNINRFGSSKRNSYLDSGFVLAEKAISLCHEKSNNEQLRRALGLKSAYMWERKGDIKEARRLFEESLKYGYKDSPGHYEAVFASYCLFEDYYEAAAAFYKFRDLKSREEVIPVWIYNKFCLLLFRTGFPGTAEKYLLESLAVSTDSADFYRNMCVGNLCYGNYDAGLDYANKALKTLKYHFRWAAIAHRAICYMALGNFDSAFEDISKNNLGRIPELKAAEGYIYLTKGQSAQAGVIFKEAVASLENSINTHETDAALYYSHLYMAMNYSAMGEKEKALAYLKEVTNKKNISRYILIYMQSNPMFDNIRNEPEFKNIQMEFEKKYNKEHQRIATLLKQKGDI